MSRMIAWCMAAMALDIGLVRLGYGLVLPAIRRDLGGSFSAFGSVATAHFVGYLLGSLAAPWLLGRDPAARRTALGAHLVVAVTLVACAAASGVVWLAAARFLMGLACGVGIAAIVVGSQERVEARLRGTVSGLAWGGIGIGLIVCAPPTPWLLAGTERWRVAHLCCAALAVAIAFGMGSAFRAPVVASPSPGARGFVLGDLLRPRRYLLLVLAYVTFGIAYTAYATFIVAALRATGAGSLAVALLWTGLGVATVAGALAVGRIAGGRWRRWALASALGVAAAGSALGAAGSTAFAVAGALFVGLGLASTPAIASALARARSTAETGATAFVAITTLMALGQIAGPVAAGAIADRAGAGAVPLLTTAVYALGALVASLDGVLVPQRATG